MDIKTKLENARKNINQVLIGLEQEEESDAWMKKATEFYENGSCPICFSTDEVGCKEGCYLGQLQRKDERYEKALWKIIKESGNVDRSEWPTQQQKCQAIAEQALKGSK